MDMENVFGEVEANGGRGHGKLLLQCGTNIRSPLGSEAVFPINGRLQDECLNEHLFPSLRHARYLIAAWRDDYNHHRPHSSLDGLTPREYHQRSRKDQTLNRANS